MATFSGGAIIFTSEQIAAGSIIGSDIASNAAIAFSKLAALTDSYVLVGNASNVATAVVVSGDVTLANTGATTVTDLTIASEAQGDILYFNGTNWVRLAPGTSGFLLKTNGAGANPSWSATTNPVVISAGCNAGTSWQVLDNTTEFNSVYSPLDTAGSGTESTYQRRCGINGTVVKIWADVLTNDLTNAAVLTLRANTADTAATITLTSAGTGYFESTGLSVAVADTDLLAWKMASGLGGTEITFRNLGVLITPTNTT